MSFSSAEWTIPELCVWIVTRSRVAVNGLSSSVRQSLKYSDMVHSGAYAARDEVIEAAQRGTIIITCAGERDRYRSNPDRTKLPRDFWNNAELVDAGHWQAPHSCWCVARQIGQPNKDYHDLLVDSAKAKGLWSPPEPRAELAASAPAAGGSISPLRPTPPSGARVADADPAGERPQEATSGKPPATDGEMRKWMVDLQRSLKAAGKHHGRDIVLAAAREKFGVVHKIVLHVWNAREV